MTLALPSLCHAKPIDITQLPPYQAGIKRSELPEYQQHDEL
jgi:hypothetical protein